MAIKVKEAGASAVKWAENAGRATQEYGERAVAASEDWARATAAAADTFHQAVTAPGIEKRFQRGVTRAGAAKFARKVSEVGRDRFAPGVAAAQSDYSSGVEPYLSTIAALTLPARKPRGDPSNYRRVEAVGKALNSKRLALLGVSPTSAGG